MRRRGPLTGARPLGAAAPAGSRRPAGAARGSAAAPPPQAACERQSWRIGAALVLVLAGRRRARRTPCCTARHAQAGAGMHRADESPTALRLRRAKPEPGPYGHIGTRKADPQPLTVAELYPATFAAGGTTVVRTASERSGDCDRQCRRISPPVGDQGRRLRSGGPRHATCPRPAASWARSACSTSAPPRRAKKAERSADASDTSASSLREEGPDPQDRQGHRHRGGCRQGPLPDPHLG